MILATSLKFLVFLNNLIENLPRPDRAADVPLRNRKEVISVPPERKPNQALMGFLGSCISRPLVRLS
jgi:hypothetical protein